MTRVQAPPHTGFGVVGLGVAGEPPQRRTRPDLCEGQGHPGCTYNPWSDKTWCLCGTVIRDGDQATHAACCGGPLEERANGVDDLGGAA